MSVRVLSVGLLMLLFCFTASADEFTFTASGDANISLALDGTESSTPGVFYITGATGTVDSLAATLLPTTGPGVLSFSPPLDSVEFGYDNVLNMNPPSYFDIDGLGLALSDGTVGEIYTPNFLPGLYFYLHLTPTADDTVDELFLTVSPAVITPEPSSGILTAITSIVLLLGIRRFRFLPN